MSTDHTPLERFIITYTANLRSIHGGDAAWIARLPADVQRDTPEATLEALATKVTHGLLRGGSNKEGDALKRTCKQLGIKHTYVALTAYFGGVTDKELTGWYVTTYCNFAHRVADGQPIDHECAVLPPAAIAAERNDQYEMAIQLLQAAKPFRISKGVRAK